MNRFTFSVLLGIVVFSCKITKVDNVPDVSRNITWHELKLLSKECDYVISSLKSKMIKKDTNNYEYNFRVINLWGFTDCLKGLTPGECVKIVGKPSRTMNNDSIISYFYEFYKEGELDSECTLIFIDSINVANACLTNIEIDTLN